MEQVAPVTGRVTAIEANRERLAALGTMAAGLAHELNNPAAAARRAAAQLTEALEAIGSTLGAFVEAGIERDDAERLVALQREAVARAAAATALDALDASDAEEELLGRLEALEVEEPWRLAEPLAAAGVDQQWLARVAELAGPATGAALRWVAATLTAGRLAAELQESTERLSALVGAVKSYAYLDRGDLVEVDVHEGLETTLTVLGYKLKHTAIEVVRDYDRTLPRLTVRGSELNQVWTNLLDNAIDALGSGGRSRSRHGPTAAARWSRSPTTAPASRRTSRGGSSTRSSRPRTSATARASAWPPRGASSWSATTARSRSTLSPAAPPSACGCPLLRPEAAGERRSYQPPIGEGGMRVSPCTSGMRIATRRGSTTTTSLRARSSG